jgi:tungstate transport system permease protein
VAYIWHQLQAAWPLIWISGGYVQHVALVTIRIALVATFWAVLLGLPAGLALGLGRFRGRRTLHVLANVSLGIPPVLVGIFVMLLLMEGGVFGDLRLLYTLRAVYIAQTLLALPYVVALTAAAVQGLPPGLLAQARTLGAGRTQLAALALREARVGVIAAVIAALASTLTEVAAVIIVGGNVLGADQTLGSAIVDQLDNYDSIPSALALGIVLLALIFVLIGVLTALQQLAPTRLRLRWA